MKLTAKKTGFTGRQFEYVMEILIDKIKILLSYAFKNHFLNIIKKMQIAEQGKYLLILIILCLIIFDIIPVFLRS